MVGLASELDSILGLIHGVQDKLSYLEHSVQLRRASINNALSPASIIPTEIARHIFMLAVDNGRDDSLLTRLSISQTCQYWRTVSLAIPEFWQSLVLNAVQSPLFEHLRLRSYPLPMWLRVKDCEREMRDGLLGRPENVEGLSESMTNEYAASQPSRIISLRIEDNGRFSFPQYFGDSLLPISMDTLQVFSSKKYGHNGSAMFSPRTIAANGLHFSRAWIEPMHLDVTQLAKLSLVDIPYECMGRLLAMAADCPALEMLHLERIRRKEALAGTPVLLLAPWLSLDIRTLGIVNCDEELWMQLFATPTFRLPKLTSFALEHGEEFASVPNWGTTPEAMRDFVSRFIKRPSLY